MCSKQTVFTDRWRARFVPQAIVCWPLPYTGVKMIFLKVRSNHICLSYLKSFTASLSAPSSSQSPVDLAPYQLSHCRWHCAPCSVCNTIVFAVPGTYGSVCQRLPLHACPFSLHNCLSSFHQVSENASHFCRCDPSTLLS